MKLIKIIYLFAFLGFTIAGCSDDTVNPNNPGSTVTVNGKVTDLIGGGINGVTVIIGESTAVTSVDGSFSIGMLQHPTLQKYF